MTVFSPSTPSGHSLFCDEIRQEDNGKQLLIGLYNGDMLVESLPILLPSFRILIRYQERPTESRLPVRFVVTAPDESGNDLQIFQAEVPREAFDQIQIPSDDIDEPFLALALNAAFSPLILAHQGRIKVRAYRGDDEIRLGTLRIRLRADWEEEQQRIADSKQEAAN
jgi:hypothetical protein